MMEEVEVYLGNEGHICLKQSFHGEDDRFIIIHPEQVNIVIKWLRETLKEAQSK